jgi:hypothetical protein
MSSSQIAEETGLERKRVLRALTLTRQAIAGAQVVSRTRAAPRNRPLIGIGLERGCARAVVVSEVQAAAIQEAIQTGRWHADVKARYDAVVWKGRFYRLRPAAHGAGIGELESFWSYLRQRLRAKGGIRRERLGLYLAEYTWRYNRRTVPLNDQVGELLGMLQELSRG